MGKLLLLLVGLVLLELTVMIKVGSVIGALPTVGLLVLTAVLGSSLVRSEGSRLCSLPSRRCSWGDARPRGDGWHDAGAGGLVADYPGICERYCRHPAAAALAAQHAGRQADWQQSVQDADGGFQARQQPFEPGPGDDRPGQSPRGGGNTIEGEFERKE